VDTEIEQIVSRLGWGQHRVLCPFCAPLRKKKKVEDLSVKVDADGATYLCHHCGENGSVKAQAVKEQRRQKPVKRVKVEKAEPKSEVVQYFADRGISEATLTAAGVGQDFRWFRKLEREEHCAVFPYRDKHGETYAAKYATASATDKDHSCDGAPQSLWLADQVEDWEEVVITEGEKDTLAMIEAGVINPMSIPNGALNPGTKNVEHKLRYIDNHASSIEKSKRIVIAMDNDDPGRFTAKELSRRFGKDRCFLIEYPEGCKDANDILLKEGAEGLLQRVKEAKPYPVEGAMTDAQVTEQARRIREQGAPKGAPTGLPELDAIYSVPTGKLTVVTGHPGSGKSQLLDQILVNLAHNDGWRTGVIGFENDPGSHLNELSHMWLGKTCYPGQYGAASEYEAERAEAFISRHFKWAEIDDQMLTVDRILEIAKGWVRRVGIRALVVDPFNYISKNYGEQSETDWISTMLSRFKQFAMAHDVHVFFVAHPTKMQKHADGALPVPTGYDISGSAAWFAKADLGLTVHRPNPGEAHETTELHIWKAKRSWMGKVGKASFWYSPDAHQYVSMGSLPNVRKLVEPVEVPF